MVRRLALEDEEFVHAGEPTLFRFFGHEAAEGRGDVLLEEGERLLEVGILILQLVSHDVVELGQELEDWFGGAHRTGGKSVVWGECERVVDGWQGGGNVYGSRDLGNSR